MERSVVLRIILGGPGVVVRDAQALHPSRLGSSERFSMEWTDVQDRIEQGESDQTEMKQAARDTSKLGPAICAFANTTGGLLILGVADDGRVLGVAEDPDKVQERLTNLLQNGCSAPVSARLGRHADGQRWVHWIEVPRQRGLEPLRYDQRVYVRRSRSSVQPSAMELQELYNAFGYVLTEERTIAGTSSADIDDRAFREYLEQLGIDSLGDPQPDIERDLINRGVLSEGVEGTAATLYGVLCFGRDPQRYPQTRSFWIECVAYDGEDRADDVALVGEATGRADEQVIRALGWVRALGRFEQYRGMLREDVPLVPAKALREALVNAVAHRDYAVLGSRILLEVFRDRVVVTSPGALPNHMRPESVRAGGHPRSRNELVANFLQTRRLMEQRGRGWPIMRRAMMDHNGTEPELLEDRSSPFVRVTLAIRPPG
jgi:ATP-dependent DNA helicase RecG